MNDESQLIRSAYRATVPLLVSWLPDTKTGSFRALSNILGDPDESEDVVQESFVQAYLKLDTFQQQSQFFTWLYRIAFNNALSRRRRRRVTLSIDIARDSTGCDPSDTGETPDSNLVRRESIDQVRQAMLALSDDHRMILTLREMQDLSYEEISSELAISIGNRSFTFESRSRCPQTPARKTPRLAIKPIVID